MRFDWTITLGSLLMMAGTIASVTAAYFALLRQVDERFVSLGTRFSNQFNEISIQLTKILDGDVRELRGRLVLLESGQSEWIKTVRERTHQLANEHQGLLMRVDRLERPSSH